MPDCERVSRRERRGIVSSSTQQIEQRVRTIVGTLADAGSSLSALPAGRARDRRARRRDAGPLPRRRGARGAAARRPPRARRGVPERARRRRGRAARGAARDRSARRRAGSRWARSRSGCASCSTAGASTAPRSRSTTTGPRTSSSPGSVPRAATRTASTPRADDALAAAEARKLQYAIDALALVRGSRVLDMGCGWGSFLEYAGARGIAVHGITISRAQYDYVARPDPQAESAVQRGAGRLSRLPAGARVRRRRLHGKPRAHAGPAQALALPEPPPHDATVASTPTS